MDNGLSAILGGLVGSAFTNWLAIRKERETRREQHQFNDNQSRRADLQAALCAAVQNVHALALHLRFPRENAAESEAVQKTALLVAELKKSLLPVIMHSASIRACEYDVIIEHLNLPIETTTFNTAHFDNLEHALVGIALAEALDHPRRPPTLKS